MSRPPLHNMRLPSGAMATRQGADYYVWSGNGALTRLTADDLETLFADSLSQARAAEPGEFSDADEYADERCTDPGGHVWHEGPPDRGDEGPIRCIHCGADGDA